MDVCINDVFGQVYMNLSAFSCLEMIRQLLESNLGIGKLKMGFLGEKCLVSEPTYISSPSVSNLPRLASGPYVSSAQRVVVLGSRVVVLASRVVQ